MAHTREDFVTLMKTFRVPLDKKMHNIGDDHIIFRLRKNFPLCTGVDAYGRHYVNIPINMLHFNGTNIVSSIFIYQRKPDTNNFKIASPLYEPTVWSRFLKRSPLNTAHELDFLNLAVLLAGREVLLYNRESVEPKGSAIYGDPASYFTLSLYGSSASPV